MDNDISILLKEAKRLKIPSKFVQIRDKKYSSMIDEIKSLIPTGMNLYSLYEIFTTILPEDLVILYTVVQGVSEEVLNEINGFNTSLEISKIRDVAELKLLIQDWNRKYVAEFEENMNKLDRIEEIQEELSKFVPLDFSPVKVESSIILAQMQFKDGRVPTTDDAYEIFDFSIPQKNLPYIRWNTSNSTNKELIKIYTGKTLEERPDYAKIISFGGKEIKNTLNFSVGKGEENLTKESFLKGVYSLETNVLKIKIPLETGQDKSLVLNKISESLPLVPNKIDEKSISGEVYIFDIEINDQILSHLILNDDIFKNYFFMKEMGAAFALKKQLKIFFRSLSGLTLEEEDQPSSVAFSIKQNYAKGEETVLVRKNNREKEIKLKIGTPYVRIHISSADSLEVAQDFLNIFSRILEAYKTQEENISNFYLSYIPDFKNIEQEQGIKKLGREAKDTKLERLKKVAPDLFIADYARKCLCPFQPIPITDDEVEDWEAQTFEQKGETLNRQVLQFPPDDPKFNFVCPDDKYPFPGVKKNKLDNKTLYASLPCCFMNDQIGSNKSKYNQIYFGDGKEEVKVKDGHMIRSDKIVKAGRYGSVPNSINDFLKNDASIQEIRRKGVPVSPNSLLHAISIAISDPRYLEKTEVAREKYVGDLRKVIAGKTDSNLCKQEMYDFSLQDIRTSLRDTKVFLDPNLYYRVLEEAYKINIFVFAPSADEEKRLKTKSDSTGIVQLPRFKLFPARSPKKDRPTILIYRTLGSESDILSYPQCELLLSYSENNEVSVFEENIYKMMFNATLELNRTITWELVYAEEKGDKETQKEIETLARNNIYSQVNYFEITGKKAVKQYIDVYGKLRGLYVDNLMLIFPASSPENLPVSATIVRTSYQKALKMFANPIAYSADRDGLMDGLWFPVLDLVYGIYIPIIPQTPASNLSLGPNNPLGEVGSGVVSRIVKIRRDLDFILQSLKWLLAISGLPLEDFMNKYSSIGEMSGDSSQIYDFKNIGRTFPQVDTVEVGIIEMKKRVPTLFVGDRLFLYSEKMFNGVLYLMQQYVKEYPLTQIPKSIHRSPLMEQDFISSDGVALFLTEADMKTWLESLNKVPEILTSININNALKTDPYLYLASDGHIYLVQNVMNGNVNRALNVGYYWRTYKVNPGFKSPEYDELAEPKYVIYDISPANTAVPAENKAGDSLDFLSVLRYNSLSYAAMLRLL
tara:strand:- start:78 stop:3698 length:3621 start_codon:yes stop_codon:yes gene_type:complete